MSQVSLKQRIKFLHGELKMPTTSKFEHLGSNEWKQSNWIGVLGKK